MLISWKQITKSSWVLNVNSKDCVMTSHSKSSTSGGKWGPGVWERQSPEDSQEVSLGECQWEQGLLCWFQYCMWWWLVCYWSYLKKEKWISEGARNNIHPPWSKITIIMIGIMIPAYLTCIIMLILYYNLINNYYYYLPSYRWGSRGLGMGCLQIRPPIPPIPGCTWPSSLQSITLHIISPPLDSPLSRSCFQQ